MHRVRSTAVLLTRGWKEVPRLALGFGSGELDGVELTVCPAQWATAWEIQKVQVSDFPLCPCQTNARFDKLSYKPHPSTEVQDECCKHLPDCAPNPGHSESYILSVPENARPHSCQCNLHGAHEQERDVDGRAFLNQRQPYWKIKREKEPSPLLLSGCFPVRSENFSSQRNQTFLERRVRQPTPAYSLKSMLR